MWRQGGSAKKTLNSRSLVSGCTDSSALNNVNTTSCRGTFFPPSSLKTRQARQARKARKTVYTYRYTFYIWGQKLGENRKFYRVSIFTLASAMHVQFMFPHSWYKLCGSQLVPQSAYHRPANIQAVAPPPVHPLPPHCSISGASHLRM